MLRPDHRRHTESKHVIDNHEGSPCLQCFDVASFRTPCLVHLHVNRPNHKFPSSTTKAWKSSADAQSLEHSSLDDHQVPACIWGRYDMCFVFLQIQERSLASLTSVTQNATRGGNGRTPLNRGTRTKHRHLPTVASKIRTIDRCHTDEGVLCLVPRTAHKYKAQGRHHGASNKRAADYKCTFKRIVERYAYNHMSVPLTNGRDASVWSR